MTADQPERPARELDELRRRVQDLLASNASLAARLARAEIGNDLLNAELAEARARYGAQEQSPELQHRIMSVMALLRPMGVAGVAKRRVGREGDGGYVVLDDLDGIQSVITLGVGDDVSREVELAELGAKVVLVDHAIAAPPAQHPNFSFLRQKVIGGADAPGLHLDEIIARHATRGASLLNIDIEGDEWAVLDAADESLLIWFKQVTCEFHHFSRCRDAEFWETAVRVLRKLDRAFQVVHVHGNNCSGYSLVGNVPCPEVLEVTLANREAYGFVEDDGRFPTPLDRPNDPQAADLLLGRSFHDATMP